MTPRRPVFPASRRALLAAALLAAPLAGCADAPRDRGLLAHACQTRPCACEAPGTELFGGPETAGVLWRPNGDAYCPAGFALKRTDAE